MATLTVYDTNDASNHSAFDKLIGAMLRGGIGWDGGFALLALQGISELIKRVAFLNDYPVDSLEAHYERPQQ